MLRRIKDLILYFNRTGLPLPVAHDGVTNKPSVTLLVFYSGLILSIISIALLHNDPDRYLSATLITLLFLCLGFLFYRLRKLDRVKIDLDDRSIEIEGGGNGKKGKRDRSSGGDSEGSEQPN